MYGPSCEAICAQLHLASMPVGERADLAWQLGVTVRDTHTGVALIIIAATLIDIIDLVDLRGTSGSVIGGKAVHRGRSAVWGSKNL